MTRLMFIDPPLQRQTLALLLSPVWGVASGVGGEEKVGGSDGGGDWGGGS